MALAILKQIVSGQAPSWASQAPGVIVNAWLNQDNNAGTFVATDGMALSKERDNKYTFPGHCLYVVAPGMSYHKLYQQGKEGEPSYKEDATLLVTLPRNPAGFRGYDPKALAEGKGQVVGVLEDAEGPKGPFMKGEVALLNGEVCAVTFHQIPAAEMEENEKEGPGKPKRIAFFSFAQGVMGPYLASQSKVNYTTTTSSTAPAPATTGTVIPF